MVGFVITDDATDVIDEDTASIEFKFEFVPVEVAAGNLDEVEDKDEEEEGLVMVVMDVMDVVDVVDVVDVGLFFFSFLGILLKRDKII
jgi:hypothetical protein